jgi:hypothetical protein
MGHGRLRSVEGKSSQSLGRTFAFFREAVARAAQVRRGEFLYALSKRNTIEHRSNGVMVGNLLLSDGELDEIVNRGWDGSPLHADELVGDWLDDVLADDHEAQR